MPNAHDGKQETNAGQTSRAPEAGLVLLRGWVAFVNVDGLGHGRGDSEGNSGANLESRVDLVSLVY